MSTQVPKSVATVVIFATLAVAAAVNAHVLADIAQSRGHYKFARLFYLIAATWDDGMSQNNLAGLYAEGLGGARDDQAAARWFQRAADNDIVEAKFNLSNFYESGRGVERNTAASVLLLREAASEGYVEAAFNLGQILSTGRNDFPKDIPGALQWYRQAAEAGYASAQYNLGSMYAQGVDVDKDLKLAATWFERAAAQNHAKAQMDFGTMLAAGLGEERQFIRGIELLRKSVANPEIAAEATKRIRALCAEASETAEIVRCTTP